MLTLVRWIIVIGWRFFSGAHLNGKQYNDSSWWHDASTRFKVRRHTYTWWRRKARMKRAGWRNSCFWIATLITLGFAWSISAMLWILGASLPLILWLAYGRIRLALFMPVVGNHSDGSVRQHWIMKPKTRRMIEMVRRPKGKRKRPGLALPSEIQPGVHLREIPSEYADAVRRDVTLELDEQPPIELKLLMTPDD